MGGGGGGKGGGSETKVMDMTPQYIKDMGKYGADHFKQYNDALEGQQNPYAQWNSLFSNQTGQSYLDAFSAAPKAAYDTALQDTKELFGANGLYGSVGNDMMSGAMANAGSQYANSMAQAQILAQQAQLQDYNAAAQKGLFDFQKQQQLINNALAAYSGSAPLQMQGQTVVQEEEGGKGGGFMGGLGSAVGMATSFF